jgi:predicted nucleotidyltransferase
MMKTKSEYISLLHHYMQQNAEKYALQKMGIFGSVARGDHRKESDIDVFVVMDKPNLFSLIHIKEELQELLHTNVDIVRFRTNMDSLLMSRITKEGLYV